jgi:hypothetical protein
MSQRSLMETLESHDGPQARISCNLAKIRTGYEQKTGAERYHRVRFPRSLNNCNSNVSRLALRWWTLTAFFRSRLPTVSNKCYRHGRPQEEAFALRKRSSRSTRHNVVAANHLLRCDRNATVTMILQHFASRKRRVACQWLEEVSTHLKVGVDNTYTLSI